MTGVFPPFKSAVLHPSRMLPHVLFMACVQYKSFGGLFKSGMTSQAQEAQENTQHSMADSNTSLSVSVLHRHHQQ